MIWKNDDVVGSLIHDVAHGLRLRIDETLRPYGLTRVSWLAMGILQQNDKLTQSELALALELGTAATGKLIDRLEDRGLVKRLDHPGDRRAYQLALTAKAKELLTQLEPVSDQLRDEILNDISDAEQNELRRILEKIKDRLMANRSQST